MGAAGAAESTPHDGREKAETDEEQAESEQNSIESEHSLFSRFLFPEAVSNRRSSNTFDVARFASLLKQLDRSMETGDAAEAAVCHDELVLYTEGRGAWESIVVDDPEGDEEYGILQQRQSLHSKWCSFRIHGGSWDFLFKQILAKEGSNDAALLLAATDLMYMKPPLQRERMDLWLFCAHLLHHPAESAADAEHSTGAAAEREEELEELDQIRLDALRTPFLESAQRETLVRVLRTYCTRLRYAVPQDGAGHYVQGMHMLVACTLWAGFSEVQALQLFEYILATLCKDYYTEPDFRSFLRDVYVASSLAEKDFASFLLFNTHCVWPPQLTPGSGHLRLLPVLSKAPAEAER